MFKQTFLPAVRVLLVLMVLPGRIYPLPLMLMAGVVFPAQANGSLITVMVKSLVPPLWGRTSTRRAISGRDPRPSLQPLASGGSNGADERRVVSAVRDRAAALNQAHVLSADAVIATDSCSLRAAGSIRTSARTQRGCKSSA